MEAVELLRKIVSVDSVFPNEKPLAEFLIEELRRLKFTVKIQAFGAGRMNVLATRGNRGKPLLLYAHMDTVPPYGYENNPLQLQEKDGRLFGLGAYDMKAGVAAILKAVENTENDRAIKIMFVSDEEADSAGCFEVTKTDFLDDVEIAISPDVGMSTTAADKTNVIGLGRRGRVQYAIEVNGKSYHAAMAEKGISAITEASKIAVEIEKMNDELPSHPQLGHGNQFVRKFYSESVSLSVPDKAILLVDRHLIPPENAEAVRKELEDRIKQMHSTGMLRSETTVLVKVNPRHVPYMMPYVTDQGNAYVQKLSTAIKSKLNCEVVYSYAMSVADENMIAMQGIPIITYGPIGSGEHSSEEWVSKQSYLEMIQVLKEFVES